MVSPQAGSGDGTRAVKERSPNAEASHALRATLWEEVQRRLAAGARGLAIDVRHDSAMVELTGVVSSFYAKQVLYQVCRRCAPGFRVIDTTVVGSLPTEPKC